jgi:hypothetical protein
VKNHPEYNYQYPDQKHKNRNPVDAVHIPDPAVRWLIRIPLPDIKVFSQFAEYSHLDIKDN